MRGRTLTFRFVALLVSLLIIYPTLFAFFIQSSSFSDGLPRLGEAGLRTSFLLFKQPLLAILAMTLFFLFAKSSSHNDPLSLMSLSRWREFSGFLLIGTLCLVLSSATQLDLNRILNSGISIRNNKVHWDTHRWGGVPFLSESDPVGEQYLWVRSPQEKLKKIIHFPSSFQPKADPPLAEMGEGTGGGVFRATHNSRPTTVLKWYGLWQDGNGNGVLDESERVWLSVNGEKYDVTEKYRGIPAGTPRVFKFSVGADLGVRPLGSLGEIGEGRHIGLPLQVVLEKTGTSDSIGWVAQATYLSHQTAEWKPDPQQWQTAQFQEAMVWIVEPNPWYFSLLFKLGYLLRWFGMILLFFAFFGRRWVLNFVKRSPILTATSLIYAPLILLLGVGLRQSWPWLARGVGWSLYGLLKLIPVGGEPFIRIPDGIHVEVGIERFWVNIADTCSGMESIGLFVGMYLGLILFNYRQLRLGRALALIVPGLVGTYIVNVARIYGLFLAGLMWGNEVMNLFHTYLGMVLFVGWFLVFWRVIQRWICLSSLNAERCPLNAVCAPAVVSGLLVFYLLAGQEVLVPMQDTMAVICPDHTASTTWKADGADCGKTAFLDSSGPWCFEQPGCDEGEVVPVSPPYPGCGPGGTSVGSGSMECIPSPPCEGFTVWWTFRGSDCSGYAKYTKRNETPCPQGCTPSGSMSPSPDCASYGSTTTVSSSCVPEFPAFFPWLFSLLAPLLRWRWMRG